MQILTVSEQGTWFEAHIVGYLREAGHSVETFFYGPAVGEFYGAARAQERAAKNRDLLALAKSLKTAGTLDLVFCYVYDDFLAEETARALQALGVPMVNYNVDMACQWYRQIRTAKHFTLMLCAQTAYMREFTRHGGRTYFFPMAARVPAAPTAGASTAITKPVAAFVGTPMPFRIEALRALSQAQLPVHIYGNLWQEGAMATPGSGREKLLSDVRSYAWARYRAEGPVEFARNAMRRLIRPASKMVPPLPPQLLKGFVPNGQLADVFAGSAVNIGFSRISGDDPNRPGRTQVKLRDFEVPAAGGFYLVEEAEDHALHFGIGSEIATWRRLDELIDRIGYYLDHDAERQQIARAGQLRTLRDHTWARRFEGLFSELGIA